MLGLMTEDSGNSVLVHCRGRLVAGENAWSLYNTVIAQQHKQAFTLDMTGVDRVDARGLGVLVVLKQWAMGSGAKLEIIPSKPVQELIELTGLADLFEIRLPQEATPAAELLNDAHEGPPERRCA